MTATTTGGTRATPTPWDVGIGLRLPHLLEVAATRPAVAWFEVHPENVLANPHAREVLAAIATHYPISVHTVGVSVGSAHGVDRAHLARVTTLVNALDPFLVSGHLAWSTHPGEYLNDLLPLPYTEESLALVATHVDEVQQVLGRRFVLENPASYVGFTGSTMRETEFLGRLAERSGCQLLCDVSNIVVSATNLGYDPLQYLRELGPTHVAELHLGGFDREPEGSPEGAEVLIDTHDRGIAEESWALYAMALQHLGPRPTLIEWDTDVPALAVLQEEAARASEVLRPHGAHAHAAH